MSFRDTNMGTVLTREPTICPCSVGDFYKNSHLGLEHISTFSQNTMLFFHPAVCLTRDAQQYRINDIVSTFVTQEGFSVSVFFIKQFFSAIIYNK